MTPRRPRKPGMPGKQPPLAPVETITAEKHLPSQPSGGSQGDRISASREAPIAVLERVDDAATVIAFPEPPGRRRRKWWLAGIIGTVAIVAGLIAYLVFSPALAVRTLDVQGNQLVPEDQVTAALAPLLGTSLTRIGNDDVRVLLDGFAPIKDVSIAAAPPSTLSVTVIERTPVAVLESDGKFILIDAEGRELTTVADRKAAALPLIDGGTNAVNSEVFSSIADVLAALPADIRKRLVHASAGSIDSVELKLTDGKTIFWGSAEENAEKSRVIAALLTIPEQDPPVKVYDVSTPSRPVTR